MKCEACDKDCTEVIHANWHKGEIKMVCAECLNMITQNYWESAYKDLKKRYTELLQNHKQSLSLNDNLHKGNNKLKLEIRSLHRKLRDANRGAERLHLINAQLRIELVEYKIKHPETTV